MQSCENSIKKSVGVLNGVLGLKVDLKGKKVTVEYDPAKVNVKIIEKTIEDQGYDVEQ